MKVSLQKRLAAGSTYVLGAYLRVGRQAGGAATSPALKERNASWSKKKPATNLARCFFLLSPSHMKKSNLVRAKIHTEAS
ncbi:jg3043 [Pararge aegeria aegeria]|uniref:Jg3043 protein n=1 Tax=Pararge aegeria aegeria TaxID=348720 RepID=A0A8S4RX24_9NEOP|nr:jg3043 [Pararge aegeria aegeria]